MKRNSIAMFTMLVFGILCHTTLAVAQSAQALRLTLPPDTASQIGMHVLPNATCNLHIDGQAIPSLKVFADEQGAVRVHVQPQAESESIASFVLDCTAGASSATFPLQLRVNSVPTPDMPLPAAEAPKPVPGARLRRALTESEALQLSQDELAQQGYPIRPDPVQAPDAFAEWLQAVGTPSTLIPAHVIENTGRTHKLHTDSTATFSSSSLFSCYFIGHCWESTDNWSGYELRAGTHTYDLIIGEWTVPTNSWEWNTWSYSSTWVGIDGDSSNGTTDGPIQAGTEQDIAAFFYPGWGLYVFSNDFVWNEALPNQPYQQIVNNFTIRPGDTVFAEVWLSANPGWGPTPTGGYSNYFIEDITSGQSISIPLYLQGLNVSATEAEWIMERTEEYGVLPDLADYGTAYMNNAYAYNGNAWVNYTGAFYEILSMYGCISGNAVNCTPNTNDLMSAPFQVSSTEMGFTWYNWR